MFLELVESHNSEHIAETFDRLVQPCVDKSRWSQDQDP
jgi:hypothetical protein